MPEILDIDICNVVTMVKASKCLNCLSLHEKLALRVWALAQSLLAAGGDDLTNINKLLAASACIKCAPAFVLDSAETGLWVGVAEELGAISENPTISELKAAIKCLSCADDQALRAAWILLLCKFNVLQNQPQVQ